jgi:hypothetical protein
MMASVTFSSSSLTSSAINYSRFARRVSPWLIESV